MAKQPSPGRDKHNAEDIAQRAAPVIRNVIAGNRMLMDLIERLDKDFPAAAGTWDDLLLEPVANGELDKRPHVDQVYQLAKKILAHAQAIADAEGATCSK